jgi:hypothetical protein
MNEPRQNRDMPRKGLNSNDIKEFTAIKEDQDYNEDHEDQGKKRSFEEYQKQQPTRGYSVEPAFSKRKSL